MLWRWWCRAPTGLPGGFEWRTGNCGRGWHGADDTHGPRHRYRSVSLCLSVCACVCLSLNLLPSSSSSLLFLSLFLDLSFSLSFSTSLDLSPHIALLTHMQQPALPAPPPQHLLEQACHCIPLADRRGARRDVCFPQRAAYGRVHAEVQRAACKVLPICSRRPHKRLNSPTRCLQPQAPDL